LLRCTPNDFFEWTPDKDLTVDGKPPIHTIRKSDKVVDLTKTMNSIPLGQRDEIEQMIQEKIKTVGPVKE